MILYTCPFGTIGAPLHPCGKAAKALDEAGVSYEARQVKGGSLMPWTWPARRQDRAEIERLSGQRWVPILVLDDGKVIAGSTTIVTWARQQGPAHAVRSWATRVTAAWTAAAECIAVRNASRSMDSNEVSSDAVTLAVRGESYRSAISPKP